MSNFEVKKSSEINFKKMLLEHKVLVEGVNFTGHRTALHKFLATMSWNRKILFWLSDSYFPSLHFISCHTFPTAFKPS